MLECLIDNIFVQCGGCVFQQTVGIPRGTNYAPLLTDLFLHSNEVDFKADLIQREEHRLTSSSDLNFRFVDNILSLNNPSFGDFYRSHLPQRTWDKGYYRHCEVLYWIHICLCTVSLYCLISWPTLRDQLTKLRQTRWFSFCIVNFPFICGNIPSALAYGVFIS